MQLMEMKTPVKVNVRDVVRQLLGANMARILYDDAMKEGGKRFDYLRVSVTCGRCANHTGTAAELILDGLPMIDPCGRPWTAKGMFININKRQNMNLFKDRLRELEGDYTQRDMDQQPLLMDYKPEGSMFHGAVFSGVNFIVLDYTYSQTVEGDRKLRDFTAGLEHALSAGVFPNLASVLIMQ
ncbi:hypothetical protein NVP1244A_163 [Vibrio phage 1.244.A._10N.261.54.C3]|nr:hypothetical protein NVP1244A_163 [Vibrio phage 1.244.A._10N.261.54.C3]AUR98791.1 hypothetical protein NVP1255O_163 [Vibrio phage 1.255.O._10N.286.45.F1]